MKRGPRYDDPRQVPLPLQFGHLIACAQGQPGTHLEKRPGGRLALRVTVENPANPKFVGKRIRVSLRTRDMTEAILRRDVIISALKKAGILSSARLEVAAILEEDDSTTLGPAEQLPLSYKSH